MHRRTLAGGAVVGAALTVFGATAASAAPRHFDVGADCADVFSSRAPGGDTVGQLCITVDHDGTSLTDITSTFTTTSTCTGSVLLRVSGIDGDGQEFGAVDFAACDTGTATATFSPVKDVASGHYVCTTLLDERFTAAQACVAIS